MSDRWVLVSGEYAFYNAGAWLGDVPVPRLYEIAYFLAHRDFVRRIDPEDVADARSRSAQMLDDALRDADSEDNEGLPSWVVRSGVGPADGSSPFG